MRESMRLYIKSNNNFDTQYMSLVFVASTKLLDKNFADIDYAVKKIMSRITNA